ncbi:hypothetical protein D3C73_1505810 [compost metagenome]
MGRFVFRLQSDIWFAPVAADRQPLELLFLAFHPLEGILLAVFPEFRNTHLLPVYFAAVRDSLLDRQTVGIPPRHIRGIEAAH